MRHIMQALTLVTAMSAAAAFAQDTQPQQPAKAQSRQSMKERKQARNAAMQKLRSDLDAASARAKFSGQQRQDFDAARQSLGEQVAKAKKAGGAGNPDREAARAAMQKLRSLASSEAFTPEDRAMLRDDFKALRHMRRHGGSSKRQQQKSAA